MKSLERKRKHHYVWAFYLRGWAVDDRNIFYFSKNIDVKNSSVKGLACEKDFYYVGDISKTDLLIINHFINLCSYESSRKVHRNLVNLILEAQQVVNTLEFKRLDGGEVKELFASNIFENYLSQIENDAHDVIKKIRHLNFDSLKEKNIYWRFSHYLGIQFVRTKKFRNIHKYAIGKVLGDAYDEYDMNGFIDRHWWFFTNYYGVNIASDIALNEKKILLLLLITRMKNLLHLTSQLLILIQMELSLIILIIIILYPLRLPL